MGRGVVQVSGSAGDPEQAGFSKWLEGVHQTSDPGPDLHCRTEVEGRGVLAQARLRDCRRQLWEGAVQQLKVSSGAISL